MSSDEVVIVCFTFPPFVEVEFLTGEFFAEVVDRFLITSFLYGKSANGVPSIENV